MPKEKQNISPKIMISGLLLVVGIVTMGLLSIGALQDITPASVNHQTSSVTTERLNDVSPASGQVRLYEDHTTLTEAPALQNLPPQPEPTE